VPRSRGFWQTPRRSRSLPADGGRDSSPCVTGSFPAPRWGQRGCYPRGEGPCSSGHRSTCGKFCPGNAHRRVGHYGARHCRRSLQECQGRPGSWPVPHGAVAAGDLPTFFSKEVARHSAERTSLASELDLCAGRLATSLGALQETDAILLSLQAEVTAAPNPSQAPAPADRGVTFQAWFNSAGRCRGPFLCGGGGNDCADERHQQSGVAHPAWLRHFWAACTDSSNTSGLRIGSCGFALCCPAGVCSLYPGADDCGLAVCSDGSCCCRPTRLPTWGPSHLLSGGPGWLEEYIRHPYPCGGRLVAMDLGSAASTPRSRFRSPTFTQDAGVLPTAATVDLSARGGFPLLSQ
jgi:hypothetical protein